ncbi:MAG: hypothetical protein AB7K24_25755 [Gemmataceae bacterium]
MIRIPALIVLLALVLMSVQAVADKTADKPAAKEQRIEVQFVDGSNVRMQFLQDKIEVETRYGKMTVPVEEIRRIDFAFRLSPAQAKLIDAAIADLNNETFERRQEASEKLLEIGPPALPMLAQASKSKDIEVAKRAKEAIEQIRARFPAEKLYFPDEDVVHTEKFRAIGKIVGDAFKAKSAYFSDMRILFHDLRSLRSLAHGGEREMFVDAGKYGSADHQWLETDVDLNAEDRLVVTATGRVDLWPQQPGQYMSEPTGYQAGRPGYQPGTLVGRIGANGPIFAIGNRFEGIPARRGRLHIQILKSPWNNASTGGYEVKILINP